MKGRRYLQLVLLGILLYFIYQLMITNPDWHKNQIFVNTITAIGVIYGIASAIIHIGFIVNIFPDGYTYLMDDIFKNHSSFILLNWAYILLPEIMLYEIVARFLDKHLTSKNER